MVVDRTSNSPSRWQWAKNEFHGLRNTLGGFQQSLSQSHLGRAALRGARGAWGLDTTFSRARDPSGLHRSGPYRMHRKGFGPLRGMSPSTIKKIGLGKSALRFGTKAFAPAMTAYSIVSGYQEGGVLGAAKAAAFSTAEWAAFEVGLSALGSSAIPLAVAAGVGYGAYKFADQAVDYGRGLRRLEMGGPIVDHFGTVATTRQRSLAALQNTHINGRMALGNEAMLMHTNIYRR